MKFSLGSILIIFPFKTIYPEQIQLMYILKKLFDNKCHAIIGLPPGISFPFSTIGFFNSYNFYSGSKLKLVYCVSNKLEVENVLEKFVLFSSSLELDKVGKTLSENTKILTFSDKEQLCINSRIQPTFKNYEINDLCDSLIRPFLFLTSNRKKIKKKLDNSDLIFYSKKPFRCVYFYNLQNKKELVPIKGIWSNEKLRKLGLRKKICPFYFSRGRVEDSNIIVTEIGAIFLAKNIEIFKNRQNNSPFLIFDNIHDLEAILSENSQIYINSLILDDCERSITLLKKRKFLINSNPKKKNVNTIFLKVFIEKRPQNKLSILKKSPTQKFPDFEDTTCLDTYSEFLPEFSFLNFFRITHLIEFIEKLIGVIKEIFQTSFKKKWTIKEFRNKIFLQMGNFGMSSHFLKNFSNYFFGSVFHLGFLQARFFNGIKVLGKFFKFLGIYSESSNQNSRVSFSGFYGKISFFSEPFLVIDNIECNHFLRTILENFKSLLICTNFLNDLNRYFQILDCKTPIYGILKISFKKRFFSPIRVCYNHNEISSFRNPKQKQNLDEVINKSSSIMLTRIFEKTQHGIICFFPTEYHLKKLLHKWDREKKMIEIFKKKRVFTQTSSLEDNLVAIENYKLSCDLGQKTIFLGTYKNILDKIELDNHYSRIILLFGDPHQKFSISSQILKKILKFSKTKSFGEEIFKTNSINQERGYLVNKFFRSKKDFGIFFIVEARKKQQIKPLLGHRLQFFKKKFDEWIPEEISKKINKFFTSWATFY